jgi:hypothetical protein
MSEFQFVICINNDSNPASLILGRVYRTLPDAEAELHNMLRVIDEDKSEPDGYLYPASMFAPIELPEVAERVLMTAGDWLSTSRRKFAPSSYSSFWGRRPKNLVPESAKTGFFAFAALRLRMTR